MYRPFRAGRVTIRIPSGAVAQLAKAPVSKTGDSRFESWLPRLPASGSAGRVRVGDGTGEAVIERHCMGHETPEYQAGAAKIALERYTHVLPGELERARDLLDSFLAERSADPLDSVRGR